MIKYEKPCLITLLGGGRTMWEFAAWLRSRGYSVNALTAERQIDEHTPKDRRDYSVPANIDHLAAMAHLAPEQTALTICFGPAWPIPKHAVKNLGNRLIDFMSIPYPSFLGGAHETWAELIGQKTWGCCLQLVTENTKQGECHDGMVISAAKFAYDDRYVHYLAFLQSFIREVEAGEVFEKITPEPKPAFFPRLNTANNGWIDWSWTTNDIVRFINAFAPYGGASTYLGDTVVRLSDVIMGELRWVQSHPFCAGLVLDVNDNVSHIACRDGALTIPCNDVTMKPGDRLHTPRAKLEEALLYRPEYDAKGDAAMNALTPGITTGSSANYVVTDPLRIQLLKPSDVTQVYVDWLNDPEVNRYLEVRHSKWTRQRVEMWVSDQVANPDVALFGIYLHERHIGNVKIGPVNRHHHYADLSYLIGERDLWGRGYATKAVNLAVSWAWKNMNLHKLQAGFYAGNHGSSKVLKKCGFEWEAVIRQQLLLDGAWRDHILTAKINPDWKP